MNTHKHSILAALIVAVALMVSPFTSLGINQYLGPVLAKAILGDEAVGGNAAVDIKGEEFGTNEGEALHIKGNKDAEIYLVEYSDLECPFCKQFHASMESILTKNSGKVAWVYKHFPLPFHPNAEPAAIASECIASLSGANGNDNFWKFTDGVFSDKIALSDKDYMKAAGQMGIQADAWNKCVTDPAVKAKVTQNQAEGSSLGVQGTPFTVIVKNENGKLTILDSINGALPEAAVQATLDQYLTQ